jgi:ParB family chromosome partitioning protein
MTTTTTIRLNKLLAWDGNVRKTEADKNIGDLAASITAHGLLQSLVVRKDKRGKYAVVAGRRRLLALESLAEAGTVECDMPVPCSLIGDGADATEISLAENVVREAMHPADEFEAFKALIEKGVPVADVAARFGVTETVVQKRLKLANVSPALLAAYRNGEMTLQHIMAFAVTNDHAAQERLWNSLDDWRKDDPYAIRDLLIEHEVLSDDPRVQFVTLKAYEKAGGTVRRDLFSDGDDGVFIDDDVLLESLVGRKLEKTAQTVRKEGWKWVEIVPAFRFSNWSDCQRRYPEPSPLLPEQQTELDALMAESDALAQLDELNAEQQSRFDAIGERIDEYENRPDIWPPETLAIAGAIVTLGADGEPSIQRGYIKPEDAPEETGEIAEDVDGDVADEQPAEAPRFSAALIESLTAQRSAALNAALLERPDIALAAAVHAIALPVFYTFRGESVLQVKANPAYLDNAEGSLACEVIAKAGEHWGKLMPSQPDDLFAWCLAQDGDTLRGLLTFCVAQTVNAVQAKADRPDCPRLHHAAQLANALKLDMAAWFTPNARNYFSRVSKAEIIEALREMKGSIAPAWARMKKPELAILAERTVGETGWLPDALRVHAPEPEPLAEAA